MYPHSSAVKGTSGIDQVVLAYAEHLPAFDVEIVHPQDDKFDLVAGHAGSGATLEHPFVAHVHGLHWTADYPCDAWQWRTNQDVIAAIRQANEVTVPSAWVAETFQRDMRFTPHIIPHGIDVDAWAHDGARGDYVLWNKNRPGDVCDAGPVVELAKRFPKGHFVTTFVPRGSQPASNINRIGLVPHDQMRQLVQNAQVYLATTKETFGIGTLEAMASGVPILGYAHGGNAALVEHGVNGYLAKPGDIDDLAEGLRYCLEHRAQLGANGVELARRWTWEQACKLVAGVYRQALEIEPPTVAVVIPYYNIGVEKLERAIESVRNQTYNKEGLFSVCVVDDGSTDTRPVKQVVAKHDNGNGFIRLITQANSGVAIARNAGIASITAKYICCLDADDATAPEFIERCVQALERDRSLGIAYTGLWSIRPDGKESLSPWPGEWDFDRQLKRQNQVPTCCVFRREMWERLGGYRQRYAPDGAGEEDAEFWLRSGAYGYKAKRVDHRGLFIYSHMSGRVSGNRQHRVTDWTAWHPWAGPDGDSEHPFASYATPKRISHPVRQYDEPTISVIIPVGPGHEELVINALDSLEAQAFRKWEAVVVWDSPDEDALNQLERAYPYIRVWVTHSKVAMELPEDTLAFDFAQGAGYARNRGAEIARAPLLVFLDADDWLRPDALEKMLHAWNEYQSIIYSDYTSKAIINKQYLAELQGKNRLHAIIKECVVGGEPWYEVAYKSKAFDYDCERAQCQPETDERGNFYIWCNVTALIPRAWHDQIGGFDETLESWEDVDYHWKMAKTGHCYHRIPEELLIYNFHQGHRREKGRQAFKNLLYYINEKHKEIDPVGCRGCGKRNYTPTMVQRPAQTTRITNVSDSDFVLARYLHPNRGAHQVVGAAIHDEQYRGFRMVRKRDRPPGWSIVYGRRAGGGVERFLVHKRDVELQPQWFLPIEDRQAIAVPETEKAPLGAPTDLTGAFAERVQDEPDMLEPHSLSQPEMVEPHELAVSDAQTIDLDAIIDRKPEFNLQMIPGVGGALAAQLEHDGITTKEDVLALGIEGLKRYKGVGDFKAQTILKAARE